MAERTVVQMEQASVRELALRAGQEEDHRKLMALLHAEHAALERALAEAQELASKAEGRARTARAAAADLRERLKVSEAEVARLKLQMAQRLRPSRVVRRPREISRSGQGESGHAKVASSR